MIDVCGRQGAASTIERYKSTIANSLKMAGVLIHEIEGETTDLSDPYALMCLYRKMQEHCSTKDEAQYQLGRLKDLHKFGMNNPDYQLPFLEEMEWKGSSLQRFVRAKVLNIRQVKQAIKLVTNKYVDQKDIDKVSLIILLAYYGSTRIDEVANLRVCDVEFADENWVRICNNKFRDLKRPSSRRQFPANVFLDVDELALLKRLVKHRNSKSAKSRQTEPLFNYGSSTSTLNQRNISSAFASAIRSITGDDEIIFHHLRHSGLSIMHAIIEKEYELAASINGLSIKQNTSIREFIVGHENIHFSAYHSLSSFSGHADIRESMGNYFHLVQRILFNKMQQQPLPVDNATFARITGIQPTKLDGLSKEEVYELLLSRLVRHAVNHPYSPLEDSQDD